jgi:hypothetical protein
MRKIIILNVLLMGLVGATEYQLNHIKKGGTLNVREVPVIDSKTVVGRIPANGTGIRIKHCKINESGDEWCYINYPLGGYHLEGWINRYYLKAMKENTTSKVHITNFLSNFYMADEENFLDKLQVFYNFPMQQYFKKTHVSVMQLRSKKVAYYKKWPKRNYRLTHMKILKRRDKYIDVQTTVLWDIKGRDNDGKSGKDIQKLRLLPKDNTFKVFALKNLKRTIFPKPEPIIEENNTNTVVKNQVKKVESATNVPSPKVSHVASSSTKKYYIKAGSFYGTIKSGYLSKITANGFGYVVQKATQNGNVIRRVYIGPFKGSSQASDALPRVRASINPNAYIQTLNN